MEAWWQREGAALNRIGCLTVLALAPDDCADLTAMAGRAMQLHCTIEDGQMLFSDGERTARIEPRVLKPGVAA